MIAVRITHQAGDYVVGQVYTLEDRRARGLIAAGYAEATTAPAPDRETAMEQHGPGGKGRPSRKVKERR